MLGERAHRTASAPDSWVTTHDRGRERTPRTEQRRPRPGPWQSDRPPRWSYPVLPRFLEEKLEGLVPCGKGPQRLEPLELVQCVSTDPQPTAAGEVQVHHLSPDRHRHPVRRLRGPREWFNGEPGLAPGEHGAGKQQE